MLSWARHRIHYSWHVAMACAGIVIGVALVPTVNLHMLSSFVWLMTGITLILGSLINSKIPVLLLAFIGGMILGLWRGAPAYIEAQAYRPLIGQFIAIQGKVSEDVEIDRRGRLVVRLTDIKTGEKPLGSSIWVTTDTRALIQRSDQILVTGKVSDGFGTFSASMYDAEIILIERPKPGDIALTVRNRFGSGVEKALTEPESSLGLGYLVGQRRGLPEELDTALKSAGLMHIVVASGYNLTILVRFSRRLFEKTSKYLSVISAGTMIISFMAITGLSPSMSRAGLVAGLSLLAWYYGRRFHPLVLLPFAMAMTVLIEPSYAWGDLGWQLSFAAFGGVMILAPLIQSYFFGDKKEKSLRRIFIETISAQITTVPLLLAAFGQMSVIAPLTNMMILPLIPLTMLLTFVAGIGGLMVPVAAQMIGFPAQIILTYMTNITRYMGDLSWATFDVKIGWQLELILFAIILASCVFLWHRTRLRLESVSIVE